MKRTSILFVAALALLDALFAGVTASAAPLSLNTGVAAWTVTQTSGSAACQSGVPFNTTNAAPVLTGALPTAFGLWVTPTAGSAWVGCSPSAGNITGFGCSTNCGAPDGSYTYSLALAGQTGGTLQFNWAADNAASILVTQGATTLYSASMGGGASFLTNTGPIAFSPGGVVIIRSIVRNDPIAPGNAAFTPHGWLVSDGAANFAPDPTPEPATFGMIGAACLAAAVARHKHTLRHRQ